MTFDTITLMMAGSITTALAGLALLGVWIQLRHETALLWWSAANIVYAAGIALFAASPPNADMPSIAVGLVLSISNTAAPMFWIGAVTFNRQKTAGWGGAPCTGRLAGDRSGRPGGISTTLMSA